jgi:hypothetical protein
MDSLNTASESACACHITGPLGGKDAVYGGFDLEQA